MIGLFSPVLRLNISAERHDISNLFLWACLAVFWCLFDYFTVGSVPNLLGDTHRWFPIYAGLRSRRLQYGEPYCRLYGC